MSAPGRSTDWADKLGSFEEPSFLPIDEEIRFRHGVFREKATEYAAIHSLPEWKIPSIAQNFELIFRRKIEEGGTLADAITAIGRISD